MAEDNAASAATGIYPGELSYWRTRFADLNLRHYQTARAQSEGAAAGVKYAFSIARLHTKAMRRTIPPPQDAAQNNTTFGFIED